MERGADGHCGEKGNTGGVGKITIKEKESKIVLNLRPNGKEGNR